MPEQHTILGGKVHVYKRPNSSLWQCSSYFAGKNRRTGTKEKSLSKAKEIAEDWYYNTVRPHSSLGYRPPAPHAILLKEMGHGDMENAARFPHLHTPDGDYELLSKNALH
jgi:Integrase core domain